jgi:hypothetical protein
VGPRLPAGWRGGFAPQLAYGGTYGQGGADQVSYSQWAGDVYAANPVEGAADAASALRAIGIASEDAGFDVSAEVGGVVRGHLGEEAVLRAGGWSYEGAGHAFGHQ